MFGLIARLVAVALVMVLLPVGAQEDAPVSEFCTAEVAADAMTTLEAQVGEARACGQDVPDEEHDGEGEEGDADRFGEVPERAPLRRHSVLPSALALSSADPKRAEAPSCSSM